MPRIRSIATVLPPHRILQPDAKAAYRTIFGEGARLSIFDHSGVDARYFVHPLDYHLDGRSFAERNRDWLAGGLDLAGRAIRDALERAQLAPADIDHLFFVTTTGLATPSLDALLCHRMGFRPDVTRHPYFGIGCAGGAGALRRAADALRGRPSQRALVLSVELCSQTFRKQDDSVVNLVGAALFGDGAAALVIEGDAVASAGPEIVDSAGELFPDSQRLMGWEFENDGLKLVLSAEIPQVIRDTALPAVRRFLRGRPVTHWVLHPGGTKVLEAYGRSEAEIAPARDSLREHGNLSSAAVLFILARIAPKPGDTALVAAVGPGFGIEMTYLRWP